MTTVEKLLSRCLDKINQIRTRLCWLGAMMGVQWSHVGWCQNILMLKGHTELQSRAVIVGAGTELTPSFIPQMTAVTDKACGSHFACARCVCKQYADFVVNEYVSKRDPLTVSVRQINSAFPFSCVYSQFDCLRQRGEKWKSAQKQIAIKKTP